MIQVLDNANIPITQPITFSVKPFFSPIEGNKGDNIEKPIPLNIFIKNKIVFILHIFYVKLPLAYIFTCYILSLKFFFIILCTNYCLNNE